MGIKRLKRLFVVLVLFPASILTSSCVVPAQDNVCSIRRVKEDRLDFLLGLLTPQVVSGIESESRFVVHSGHSGVGQGTTKEEMLKEYPGRFQRFLLYATRERRGIKLTSSNLCYAVVEAYCQDPSLSKEEIAAKILGGVSDEDKNDLINTLFPDWNEMLTDAPREREDIPDFSERIELLPNGSIMVCKEFDGVHYWFRTEQELALLKQERGDVFIIEPVRDYYQALDLQEVKDLLSEGDKIYILEGDRVWFNHVQENFPVATFIFIAPFSDAEFKERIISLLGNEHRLEVESLNIPNLLQGGIEHYVEQNFPQLIVFPQGLALNENKAFLNVKNAILAIAAAYICDDVVVNDIDTWLSQSGILQQADIDIVNANIDKFFDVDGIINIAREVYQDIGNNKVVLTAMKVIIEEMMFRIGSRLQLQNQGPREPANLGKTYIRTSQSPREYGGSDDYKNVLVNEWDELHMSVSGFTTMILEPLFQDWQQAQSL